MEHPSDETLERFAAGRASREESRVVVAHLIQGCPQCVRKLRALMEPAPVAGESYDALLERFRRELLDLLEASISPRQTLRTVQRGLFPSAPGEGKRRGQE